MKATLSIAITKPGGGIRFATKEIEISFAPYIGLKIEDTAWGNPVKIENVSYNHEEEYFDVYLGEDKNENESEFEQTKKMYRSHDWIVKD